MSAAVRPAGGVAHVEGVAVRDVVEGTRWLVDWLAARTGRVVVDGKSGSGAFVAALAKAGVPASRVVRPTADDAVAAHAGFVEAVTAGAVTHLADEVLAGSVLAAARRPIGSQGGWGFAPIGEGDVTLAESAVFAHWGVSMDSPRTGVVW